MDYILMFIVGFLIKLINLNISKNIKKASKF